MVKACHPGGTCLQCRGVRITSSCLRGRCERALRCWGLGDYRPGSKRGYVWGEGAYLRLCGEYTYIDLSART